MFVPLAYTPKTLPKGTPPELKTDLQILHDDRAAFEFFIQGILANKRLAWEIVSAWLDANNKLLVDGPSKSEKFFTTLWPEMHPDDKDLMLVVAEYMVQGSGD